MRSSASLDSSLPGDQPFLGIEFPPFTAIAVDPGSGGTPGRVYLTLLALDTFASREIISWSTDVDNDGKLLSPAGLPADAITAPENGSNPAGVLSSEAQLGDGGSMVLPAGLAVAGSGTDRTLMLMGSSADLTQAEISSLALSDDGATEVGDKLSTWTNGELSGLPNAPADITAYVPDYNGIARDPDGSVTVSLAEPTGLAGVSSNIAVVRLDSELGSPRILESWVNSPNLSGVAASADFSLWAAVAAPSSGLSAKPSSQVISLSDGRYAATHAQSNPVNSPWSWTNAAPGLQRANIGVRLLASIDAPGQTWNGTLSSPDVPVPSILNTLGNVEGRGACAINATGRGTNIGVAAGRAGSIWVLTAGEDADSFTGTGVAVNGRELIELVPGATGAPCTQPSGTFSASAGGRPLDTSAQITIPVATDVTFDASALRAGGWAYQYEWDLDGDTGNGYEQKTSFDPETDRLAAPTPTARKVFTRQGRYTVRLRLHGDFGVVEREATVVVQPIAAPTASFTSSTTSAIVGDRVSFDASGSTPTPGQRINNYHWDYGDGVVDDTQTPQTDHQFGAAGTYTVRLTVRGGDGQVSAPAAQTVIVTERDVVVPPPPPGPRPPEEVPPPPVPPGPPVDTTPPIVTLRLSTARDGLGVTLSCPAGESVCKGTVKLTATTRARVGRGRRARLRTRVVTVGQASFSLVGGQSRTLTIKLNGTGRALLKRGTLRVQVAVTARDQAGNAGTARGSAAIRRTSRRAPRRAGKKPGRR